VTCTILHSNPPIKSPCRWRSRIKNRRCRGWVDALLDDLIRPQQQRRRDGEAERLRGLEVDDEFELARLLDGQIARPGAFQDSIGEVCSADPESRNVHTVGHEPAIVRPLPERVHRRDPVTNCGDGDLAPAGISERVGEDEKPTRTLRERQ
jgi:hypothetical protein